MRAFLFPGQGSQSVGMGKDLADAFPEARAVFHEVDDALSQKLSKIMWEGPEETLTLTANAQPALMAVSLACLSTLLTWLAAAAKSMKEAQSHIVWLMMLEDHFERACWLNPEPQKYWGGNTIEYVAQVFEMFPLTLEGLGEGVAHLTKSRARR